jgi:putative inorganic carbon (HCO3(-)) transporter
MQALTAQGAPERLACSLALAAAASVLASIAASQILLALALAALLLSGLRLRLPPIWLPLALFVGGTLVSLAASQDPAAGRPQLRKLFVYLMLPVAFSALRRLDEARRLVLAWAGLAALSGALGLIQFARKLAEARRQGVGFYDYYVAERISGFMSHWMTFGGQLMIVGLLVAALLMFSGRARGRTLALGLAAGLVIAAALALNMTRSIWLASAAGGLYLVWFRRRRWLLAAPVVLACGIWLAPESLRTRLVSIYRPRQEVDSNLHRLVCWRTGWRMIQARPWLGLGPEMVRLRFMEYLPADAPNPLPTGWYGHLHNLYLHYAAERGVPTALALVWLLAQMFWDFLRAARRIPAGGGDARFLLHGAAAAVLAIAVSGLFEVNLGDSEVLMLFLAVAACGYLAAEQAVREAADA